MSHKVKVEISKGGVTTPKGFLASGIYCGIKKSKRKDLGLIYSVVPASAGAAFTTNRFAASPIKVSRAHLGNRHHQAVVVNSGNANCANGRRGDADSSAMARLAAGALGIADRSVLVASTGVIGKALPLDKIKKAMPLLKEGLSMLGGNAFSQAILTTDTVEKECCVRVKLGGITAVIGGAAKGVGMIYPNMKVAKHATMLSFITTDADISKGMLSRALDEAVDSSFNMISVDGDMSTNDSVFILANGLTGNKRIVKPGRDYESFKEALVILCQVLAKEMVYDGEGATKIIEVLVKGAKSHDDARAVARRVTSSNLLKACVYGGDPNWGRIVAAAGASGIEFDPDRVDVYIGKIRVFKDGSSIKGLDKAPLAKVFKANEVPITVDLKSGLFRATALTCDLSEEYVKINSAYST